MELEFIRWLRTQLRADPRVPLGPGDDAALLQFAPGQQVVATVDTVIDGVDFLSASTSPTVIGRKSLAINLSDLAAMGAKPVAALISFSFNRQQSLAFAQGLFLGIQVLAEEFDCAIAGGDTTVYDGPLSISITCLGQVAPGRAFLRSGAKPGDSLLVTGPLGGSILGHHLQFKPRVQESLWLQQHATINAAMDISDGLTLDATRLAQESHCGIVIDLAAIPISSAARELTQQNLSSGRDIRPEELRGFGPELFHALSDGEDFELLLAASPEEAARLCQMQPFSEQLVKIGTFCEEPGLWYETSSGTRLPLKPWGYVHGGNA